MQKSQSLSLTGDVRIFSRALWPILTEATFKNTRQMIYGVKQLTIRLNTHFKPHTELRMHFQSHPNLPSDLKKHYLKIVIQKYKRIHN